MHDRTTTTPRLRRSPPQVLFTPERANRALVLVRKITSDIVMRYSALQVLRHQRDELLQHPGSQEPLEDVRTRIGQCVADLNRLHQELTDVGCVLRDWETGLVDFPAMRGTTRVWLCWRLDEPEVAHWHGAHDGFAGRQAIDDTFDSIIDDDRGVMPAAEPADE